MHYPCATASLSASRGGIVGHDGQDEYGQVFLAFSETPLVEGLKFAYVRFYDTPALKTIGNSYNVVVVYCSYYFVHCQATVEVYKTLDDDVIL